VIVLPSERTITLKMTLYLLTYQRVAAAIVTAFIRFAVETF
jgi:hypothetical protein